MNLELKLHKAKTREEIDLFWQKRDQYMREDVIPNCTLGKPLDEEDIEWFFSKEYKEHIMNAFNRSVNPLNIVFFLKNDEYVGFCVYVIYTSEDGKCFIVDYCIDAKYRNQNLGRQFFYILKEQVIKEGAKYFALNLSNENNQRFWESLGFKKSYVDEYGEDVYTNKIDKFNLEISNKKGII